MPSLASTGMKVWAMGRVAERRDNSIESTLGKLRTPSWIQSLISYIDWIFVISYRYLRGRRVP